MSLSVCVNSSRVKFLDNCILPFTPLSRNCQVAFQCLHFLLQVLDSSKHLHEDLSHIKVQTVFYNVLPILRSCLCDRFLGFYILFLVLFLAIGNFYFRKRNDTHSLWDYGLYWLRSEPCEGSILCLLQGKAIILQSVSFQEKGLHVVITTLEVSRAKDIFETLVRRVAPYCPGSFLPNTAGKLKLDSRGHTYSDIAIASVKT